MSGKVILIELFFVAIIINYLIRNIRNVKKKMGKEVWNVVTNLKLHVKNTANVFFVLNTFPRIFFLFVDILVFALYTDHPKRSYVKSGSIGFIAFFFYVFVFLVLLVPRNKTFKKVVLVISIIAGIVFLAIYLGFMLPNAVNWFIKIALRKYDIPGYNGWFVYFTVQLYFIYVFCFSLNVIHFIVVLIWMLIEISKNIKNTDSPVDTVDVEYKKGRAVLLKITVVYVLMVLFYITVHALIIFRRRDSGVIEGGLFNILFALLIGVIDILAFLVLYLMNKENLNYDDNRYNSIQ